jgi:predicted AlkP superfamily pyrophosphatase or phosphodiesterase
MRPLLVLNVVGLTPRLLAHAPRLRAVATGGFQASVTPQLPAVTCTAQATMLTGAPPSQHGVVANGWLFRELDEILFWRQSNRLVAGDKVWDVARRRDPAFTCASLFWWFNMHATADWAVTPRPGYPADGRKLFGLLYTTPHDLAPVLLRELGPFPLLRFWGPGAGIESSRWIAECARLVLERQRPTLTLVYLPHLDYDLQRFGPDDARAAAAAAAIDGVAGPLIDAAQAAGRAVMVCSEYGITRATGAVHLNRVLRAAGWLTPFHTPGVGELIDAGSARAVAVADHQVAHVYVRDPALVPAVADRLRALDGVAEVLDADGKRAAGLHHPRSGELVAVAAPDRWFSYYYWDDDARAPDFARTVDIHRKPGYDPVELFLRPGVGTRLRLAGKLLRKLLGFRTLMDVIPLAPALVRGTHGRMPQDPADGPVLLSSSKTGATGDLAQREVARLILETVFAG